MKRFLIEILLIIFLLNPKVFNSADMPVNPCPHIFQYKTRGGSSFGEITVPYDGSVFNELQLNVSYPLQDSIRKLKIDLETSFEDIIKTRMITYSVTFPYQNPLPLVLEIKYNQIAICTGFVPSSSGTIRTTLWQTNNFYIYSEDSNDSIVQNDEVMQKSEKILNRISADVSNTDVPSSPCPRVFQYKKINDYLYGEITIPNNHLNIYRLSVNTSSPIYLNGINMKINLKIVLETSTDDLIANKPIKYRVEFPFQNVDMDIQEIRFNDVVYCSGPLNTGAGGAVTKFWKSLWKQINIPVPATSTQASFINPVTSQHQPSTITIEKPQPKKIVDQANCGQVQSDYISSFVVGGKLTNTYKYPWLVALYYLNEFHCTANLITNQHILTAAHCVYRLPQENFQVVLGTTNLDQAAVNTQTNAIKTITIHSEYNMDIITSLWDIAVIVLAKPVAFQKNISPICLWSKSLNNQLRTGTVAGWGSDNIAKSTKMPYETNLAMVSNLQCLKSNDNLRILINAYTFCAGNRDGTGPCKGDSGAGFMVLDNNRYYIRGLVSAGISTSDTRLECDLNNYVVFVDIAKYLDWIYQVILYN